MASRWRVSGSLLGLDVALADFSLVRLSNKPPPRKPTVGDTDRRTFIEAVALVEPRSFTDADRDTIVAAMAKGRERLESARTTADVAALADAAASVPARRALLPWVVATIPSEWRTFLSPSELFWLGLEKTRGGRLARLGRAGRVAPGMPVPADDRSPALGDLRRTLELGDDGQRVSRSEPSPGGAPGRAADAGGAARAGARVGDARFRQLGDQPRSGRSSRSRRVRPGAHDATASSSISRC